MSNNNNTAAPQTEEQLAALVTNGTLRIAHSASRRGYKSRLGGSHVEAYAGKFGKGFLLVAPRWDTSQYVSITYYLAR